MKNRFPSDLKSIHDEGAQQSHYGPAAWMIRLIALGICFAAVSTIGQTTAALETTQTLSPWSGHYELLVGARVGELRLPHASILQRNASGEWRAFETSDPTAWLVVFESRGRIETIQVTAKAHQVSTVTGPFGVHFGDDAERLRSDVASVGSVSIAGRVATLKAHGRTAFFGLDFAGRVDRFGFSVGNLELPPYIRWFQNSGREKSRPFNVVASSRSAAEAIEDDYVLRTGCGGNTRRHIGSRRFESNLEVVESACASQQGDLRTYFTRSRAVADQNIFDLAVSKFRSAFGPTSAVIADVVIRSTPVPTRPSFRLAPGILHRAPLGKSKAPTPNATPRVSTKPLSPARRRLFQANVAPASATAPPILITGYSDPPNGRRFTPLAENIVTEYSLASGFTPSHVELWVVGLNDPHLSTNCNNYVVSDPFDSQYRVNPIPSPAPRPTPEAFPMVARRTAVSSPGFANTLRGRPAIAGSLPVNQTVIRRIGKISYVYKPSAFTSVDPVSSHYVIDSDCPFSSSSNKCEPTSTTMLDTSASYCPPSGSCVAPGELQFIVVAYVGNTAYLSNPAMYQASDDPRNFQHSGVTATSTAGTVDPVSGTLFERHADFSLAGPMAVKFSRWYDSRNSSFTLGNMGNGWRHSYSDYLDLSVKCQGRVTYIDSEGNHEYFTSVAPGSASYDQQSGNSLTWNLNDSFTLTTWGGATFNFNNSGFMTAEADRHGNRDTLGYDTYGLLTTVTDPFGRVLNLSYSGEAAGFQGSLASVGVTNGPKVSFAYGSCNGSLCSVTEPDGAVWKYSYSNFDTGSYLTQSTDPNGNAAENVTYGTVSLPEIQSGSPNWNSYRVLTQSSAGTQNSLSFNYAFQGNDGLDDGFSNTTITDSLKRVTTYTWSERLQQITDVVGPLCMCGGGERHFTYDTFGRKLSENDGGGASLAYSYGEDVPSQGTYSNGMAFSQTAYPALTQITDLGYAYGRTKNVSYEPIGSVTQDLPASISQNSYVSGQNKITSYKYDATGDATQVSETGQTSGGAVTYTRSATFDSRGRQLTAKGPRTDVNATTTWAYYPDSDSDLQRRGQLKTATDAVGHVVSLGTSSAASTSYDWFGNAITLTDPNGVVRLDAFDKMGRLTTSTIKATSAYPGDIATTISYSKLGLVKTTTKPLGNKILQSRDALNRETSEIAEDKSGLQYEKKGRTFDAMGEVTSTFSQSCTTPAASCASWVSAESTSTTYDSKARPVQITYGPSGSSETVMGYNDPGSNALGSLSYIVTGLPADISAGNSNVLGYLYGYNNARMKTNAYYIDGGSASSGFNYNWSHTYSYDVNNEMSSDTPQSGPATSEVYDDWGRRLSHASPVGGTTSETYDADGNVSKITDSVGNVSSYVYDATDRVTSETSTRSSGTTESVTWKYDDTIVGHNGVGRLASMTDPSGSQTFTYDTRGNIASTAKAISGLSTYNSSSTYDSNGNVSAMTYPSGRVVNYTYDYQDRPVTVASSSNKYINSVSYEPFGPRSLISFGNGSSEQLSYDMSYLPSRLVINGPNSTKLVDRNFVRDGQRRVISETDNLNSAYSKQYTFSAFQLSGANTGSALWGTDTINPDAYFYNVTGQQYSNYLGTSRATGLQENNSVGWQASATNIGYTETSASYDANGNTTSMNGSTYGYSTRDKLSSANGINFAYDGEGRKAKASSTAYTRGYVYNQQDQLLSETSSSATSVGSEYIYLDDVPVAQEDAGGSTHWTGTDQIGTPFIQTDSSGASSWFADYEPYGMVYSLRTANSHQPLRRPGQEAVQVTPTAAPNGDASLFYNGHRWYNPLFARYSQPDPLRDQSSIDNPYAYTYLDPVDQLDKSGLIVLAYEHRISSFGPVANHVFLLLIPDNMAAFNKNQRFNRDCSTDFSHNYATTISGEPHDMKGPLKTPEGQLESHPDEDLHDLDSEHYFISEVKPPGKLSDTEFMHDLLSADAYYGAHPVMKYDPLGANPNSNGYIHSMLLALGASLNLSGAGWIPMWDNLLDADDYGPVGGTSTECPTLTAPLPIMAVPPNPGWLTPFSGGSVNQLPSDLDSDPISGGAVG